jgi:phospholipid/cholesterol/gamma-HCH transport system substrate-binding protein
MDSKVRYKIVGFFLIFHLIVFTFLLLWLAGGAGFEKVDRYIVYFQRQSLDGLQKDSLVSMRGIRVGVVEGFVISEDNIERVKVLLKLDNGIPVKTDTRAVIRRNLLTGLAKIDLIGGTQSAELLEIVDGNQYPIIPEEVTQLDKIADEVPDILEKIDYVAVRLNQLFSEENISSLESTLGSLEKITSELSVASPSLRGSIENIEKITNKASIFMDTLSGSEDVSGVASEFLEVISEIKTIVGEIRKSTSLLSPTIRKVNRSTDGFQKNISEISNSVSNLSEAYSEPKELLSSDKK